LQLACFTQPLSNITPCVMQTFLIPFSCCFPCWWLGIYMLVFYFFIYFLFFSIGGDGLCYWFAFVVTMGSYLSFWLCWCLIRYNTELQCSRQIVACVHVFHTYFVLSKCFMFSWQHYPQIFSWCGQIVWYCGSFFFCVFPCRLATVTVN
jgi:hypothetical protein